jgi:hypothetical protein
MSGAYDTDKTAYLARYRKLFAPLRHAELKLLELGVLGGGSLALWRDWFPRGLIVGLDEEPAAIDGASGRLRVYRGAQQDRALLERIVRECAPGGFDVIIDDCAHVAAHARASFRALFRSGLKSGGLYVIEDWGTGYRADWPDGARYTGDAPGGHTAGMVGFVKELIDDLEYCRDDDPELPAPMPIAELTFSAGLAVVRKRGARPHADAKSRTT